MDPSYLTIVALKSILAIFRVFCLIYRVLWGILSCVELSILFLDHGYVSVLNRVVQKKRQSYHGALHEIILHENYGPKNWWLYIRIFFNWVPTIYTYLSQ